MKIARDVQGKIVAALLLSMRMKMEDVDIGRVKGSILTVGLLWRFSMAIFSKKHYEAIACVLASTRPSREDVNGWQEWVEVTCRFLADLKTDNHKFNREKFIEATGMND